MTVEKKKRGGSAQTLRDYWSGHGHPGPSHGAERDAIAWGTPGDFDRCVAQVTAHGKMSPEQAKGYCNLRHHDALGYWPAQHAEMERGKVTVPASVLAYYQHPELAKWRFNPLEHRDTHGEWTAGSPEQVKALNDLAGWAGMTDDTARTELSHAARRAKATDYDGALRHVRNAKQAFNAANNLEQTYDTGWAAPKQTRPDYPHINAMERAAGIEHTQKGDGMPTLTKSQRAYLARWANPDLVKDWTAKHAVTTANGRASSATSTTPPKRLTWTTKPTTTSSVKKQATTSAPLKKPPNPATPTPRTTTSKTQATR